MRDALHLKHLMTWRQLPSAWRLALITSSKLWPSSNINIMFDNGEYVPVVINASLQVKGRWPHASQSDFMRAAFVHTAL